MENNQTKYLQVVAVFVKKLELFRFEDEDDHEEIFNLMFFRVLSKHIHLGELQFIVRFFSRKVSKAIVIEEGYILSPCPITDLFRPPRYSRQNS